MGFSSVLLFRVDCFMARKISSFYGCEYCGFDLLEGSIVYCYQ